MEKVIVAMWEGKPTEYPELEEAGKYAVEYLKSKGVKGKPAHLGSGAGSITKFWKEYGGTDNTPKTDFKIGKYRISLKKTGGSQLMSGKKGESRATFYAALEKSGLSSEPIVSEIEKYLAKFIEGKSELNITQQKKSGVVTKDILDAEKMHREFTKRLKSYVKDDTGFKQAIVFEAMTGDMKFGSSSDARADRVFVFDPNGKTFMFEDTDDPAFLAMKTKKAKINVSWKSVSSTTKKAGKVYSYFSVFRLTEDIDNKIQEEFNKYDGQLITEGIISKVVDRVKNWFRRVWTKVSQWLSKSFENILTFFNIEPELSMSEVTF
jgi:hypothetical protein